MLRFICFAHLFVLCIHEFKIISSCHQENIKLLEILQHIDVNLSACLATLILPELQSKLNFSLANNQQAWVLIRINSLLSLDRKVNNITSTDLTLLNNLKVTEGCRLIFDISGESVGHVNPSDWKRQSIKAFTYEIGCDSSFPRFPAFTESSVSIFPYVRVNIVFKNNSLQLHIIKVCEDIKESSMELFEKSNAGSIESPASVNEFCMHAQHGQGRTAYFESDASLAVDYLLAKKPKCGHRSYMSLTADDICTYSEANVQLIASEINVTFTRDSQIESFLEEEELSEFDPDPALVFNVEKPFLSSDLLLEGRSKYMIMNQFHCFILYCIHSDSYGNPNWIIILEAFDYYTWLGILFTGIFYTFAYASPTMGFDVINIFLGQMPQGKRQWNRLSLGLTTLGLLFLNIEYGGEETTKVTAPLPKKQIKFAKEVFKLGYRTPVPDKQTAQLGSMLTKDRYLKLGIPWDAEKTPSSIITTEININKPMQWWWFVKMANNKWVLPFPEQSPLNFGQKGLLSQNKIHNVSCYLIRNYERGEDDQHIFKRTNYYMTRGRLAQKAIGITNTILEAGISIIWRRVTAAEQLKFSQIKKSCRISSCDEESYAPLKFNSPIQVVFYWHLIFCAVSCVAFVREVFIDDNRVQTFR